MTMTTLAWSGMAALDRRDCSHAYLISATTLAFPIMLLKSKRVPCSVQDGRRS